MKLLWGRGEGAQLMELGKKATEFQLLSEFRVDHK